MKYELQQVTSQNVAFQNVPVVRLDSGAIRIPVELIDNLPIPPSHTKALRIVVNKGSFWAWRQ